MCFFIVFFLHCYTQVAGKLLAPPPLNSIPMLRRHFSQPCVSLMWSGRLILVRTEGPPPSPILTDKHKQRWITPFPLPIHFALSSWSDSGLVDTSAAVEPSPGLAPRRPLLCFFLAMFIFASIRGDSPRQWIVCRLLFVRHCAYLLHPISIDESASVPPSLCRPATASPQRPHEGRDVRPRRVPTQWVDFRGDWQFLSHPFSSCCSPGR